MEARALQVRVIFCATRSASDLTTASALVVYFAYQMRSISSLLMRANGSRASARAHTHALNSPDNQLNHVAASVVSAAVLGAFPVLFWAPRDPIRPPRIALFAVGRCTKQRRPRRCNALDCMIESGVETTNARAERQGGGGAQRRSGAAAEAMQADRLGGRRAQRQTGRWQRAEGQRGGEAERQRAHLSAPVPLPVRA